MHAMLGLRGFSLAWQRTADGVSCGEDGVFVGDVPLLNCSRAFGNERWNVRPINEINDDLAGIYRLPLDPTAKLNAIALVAAALNRGDLAMAAIATVQMRFPDPPALKRARRTVTKLRAVPGSFFVVGCSSFGTRPSTRAPVHRRIQAGSHRLAASRSLFLPRWSAILGTSRLSWKVAVAVASLVGNWSFRSRGSVGLGNRRRNLQGKYQNHRRRLQVRHQSHGSHLKNRQPFRLCRNSHLSWRHTKRAVPHPVYFGPET
jgi:hypothetical protein